MNTYRDEILRPLAVPCVQARNLIFQPDYARPHVARVCQQYLANNNVNPLSSIGQHSVQICPRLNTCGTNWGRRVRRRPNAHTNLAQLRQALHEEWDNIPIARINTLMNSMHRRIRAATAAQGRHTRYRRASQCCTTQIGVLAKGCSFFSHNRH